VDDEYRRGSDHERPDGRVRVFRAHHRFG
jgi:hypothetical protein